MVAATFRSAPAKGERLRQTSAMVRCGEGLANARRRSPARSASPTASRGSKVTPAPPATICASVGRLVARNSSSRAFALEQKASA